MKLHWDIILICIAELSNGLKLQNGFPAVCASSAIYFGTQWTYRLTDSTSTTVERSRSELH